MLGVGCFQAVNWSNQKYILNSNNANWIKKKKKTGLTEDLNSDCGLGLLVPALRHTLVDPGAVHVGVVDGEAGHGFIAAADVDVRPVGEDLLPAGGIPVNVFCISNH